MLILIVEDEPEARELLEHVLLPQGHRVCWASTGEAAIRLLDTEPVDLVLLDMMLEGRLTGWDVARYKMESPKLARIPVVVMSGMDPVAVRRRASTDVLAGAILILGKPLDMALLVRTVQALERGHLTPPVPMPRSGVVRVIVANCEAGHDQELTLGDGYSAQQAEALAGVMGFILEPRGCGYTSPEHRHGCGAPVRLEVGERPGTDAPAGLAVRWTP